MKVCVECGSPINHVYREFSKGNIRLTKCVRFGIPAVRESIHVMTDRLIEFVGVGVV